MRNLFYRREVKSRLFLYQYLVKFVYSSTNSMAEHNEYQIEKELRKLRRLENLTLWGYYQCSFSYPLIVSAACFCSLGHAISFFYWFAAASLCIRSFFSV